MIDFSAAFDLPPALLAKKWLSSQIFGSPVLGFPRHMIYLGCAEVLQRASQPNGWLARTRTDTHACTHKHARATSSPLTTPALFPNEKKRPNAGWQPDSARFGSTRVESSGPVACFVKSQIPVLLQDPENPAEPLSLCRWGAISSSLDAAVCFCLWFYAAAAAAAQCLDTTIQMFLVHWLAYHNQ